MTTYRGARLLLAVLAGVAGSRAAGAESAALDKYGRVTALLFDGEEVGVRTTLAAVAGSWSRVVGPEGWSRPQSARADRESLTYTGELSPHPGATMRVRQRASHRDGAIYIAIEAEAEADLELDGLYYRIDIPRPEFLAGTAIPSGGKAIPLASVKLPGRHFAEVQTSAVEFASASRDRRVNASWGRAARVFFQDSWERQRRFY
jgi:hypothetical protein